MEAVYSLLFSALSEEVSLSSFNSDSFSANCFFNSWTCDFKTGLALEESSVCKDDEPDDDEVDEDDDEVEEGAAGSTSILPEVSSNFLQKKIGN